MGGGTLEPHKMIQSLKKMLCNGRREALTLSTLSKKTEQGIDYDGEGTSLGEKYQMCLSQDGHVSDGCVLTAVKSMSDAVVKSQARCHDFLKGMAGSQQVKEMTRGAKEISSLRYREQLVIAAAREVG